MENKSSKTKNKAKIFFKITLLLFAIFIIGLIIPQNLKMPVVGASKKSYNRNSFWHYPWGKSITHKGVDIFAKKGTVINSATAGIVLFTGKGNIAGNYVIVLGPKWRLHYYAHLDEIKTSTFAFVNHHSLIGTVGDSGNAKGKPTHLHYGIFTPIPYFWRADNSIQGNKKMFYLNPIDYLKNSG